MFSRKVPQAFCFMNHLSWADSFVVRAILTSLKLKAAAFNLFSVSTNTDGILAPSQKRRQRRHVLVSE